MYKVAYITGPASSINLSLETTIEQINKSGGQITNVVQSQSTFQPYLQGVIVTITIIYQIK